MAFFVMLLTFAEYDIPSFDEAAAAIAERVGGTPQETPASQMSTAVEDAMFEMQADQAVKVDRDGRGIVVDLGGSAFLRKAERDFGVSSKAHKFACELRALLASDKHLGSAERSERQLPKINTPASARGTVADYYY